MSQKFIATCYLPGCCCDVPKLIQENYPEDDFVEITSILDSPVEESLKQINDLVQQGKSLLYNNYNLKLTTRDAILKFFKDINIQKICCFIIRPFEQCLENVIHDDTATFDKSTMYKMYFTMRIPWLYEGWDEIKLIRLGSYDNSVRDLFRNKKTGLDQHKIIWKSKKSNLGNKLFQAHKYAVNKEYPEIVQKASLFYQIGLPFASNYYRETSDSDIFDHVNIQICCVSAYMSLFYSDYVHDGVLLRYKNANSDIDQLATAVLINWAAEFSDFSNEDTRYLYVNYFYDNKNNYYKPLYKNMLQLQDVINQVS